MSFLTKQEDVGPSLSLEPHCRLLTFSEIQLATQNFDESFVIGRGGFGKVYKGTIPNGESLLVVAVKRLDSTSNQGALEFWAEVEMLSKLRHCHLVSLIGYCNYGQEMILVYDYMSYGTLEDHLHKRQSSQTPLPWVRRITICIGAARGLDYLHTGTGNKNGVIHRDVKSSNILLHTSWEAKISDFGLSKICPKNQQSTYVNTNVKGTFGYLDPDYFYTGKLTRKSDVYAFGVVLFEVLCGKRAVDGSLDEDQRSLAIWAQDSIKKGRLKQIVDNEIKGDISPKCLKMFAQLAKRCLHKDLKKRPTMAEIVVSLESVLALQEKANNTLQPAVMRIFGRKAPTILIPSNGENPDFTETSKVEADVMEKGVLEDIIKVEADVMEKGVLEDIIKVEADVMEKGVLEDVIKVEADVMEKGVFEDIIRRLLDGKGGKLVPLSEPEICQLCVCARRVFLSQPNLLKINAPIRIFGDIHGQFQDLLRFLEFVGYPPSERFLFLGNYVDEGKQSLETICLLLAYKILYPDEVFLLRGNHEDAKINRIHGFYYECKRRYNIGLWKIFIDCFNCLPVAALVGDKILCVHGGLSPELENMSQIEGIERPISIPDAGILSDLLWSNPDPSIKGWSITTIEDRSDSDRDISCNFGPDKVVEFVKKHDLDLICRGHQVVEDGYEFFAERRLLTIFSAPNYRGEFDNAGAVLCVDKSLCCSLQILKS